MKTVIIADIIDSKKYRDRYKSQVYLREILIILNRIFEKDIILDVVINSGDEIQGLFEKPESAYSFYRILKLLIYPMKIRAGFSIGETFNFQPDETWESGEIDGMVYHMARSALNKCKDKKVNAFFYTKNYTDLYLNTLLMTTDEIIRGMSISVNITQILCELLFPLITNKTVGYNLFKLKENLINLVELKYEIYLEEIKRREFYNSIRNNLHRERELTKINYEILFKFMDETSNNQNILIDDFGCKIENFWQKGFSTKIAEITGISRQIIDRHLSYCNYSNLRNIDGAILLFLKEYYGG